MAEYSNPEPNLDVDSAIAAARGNAIESCCRKFLAQDEIQVSRSGEIGSWVLLVAALILVWLGPREWLPLSLIPAIAAAFACLIKASKRAFAAGVMQERAQLENFLHDSNLSVSRETDNSTGIPSVGIGFSFAAFQEMKRFGRIAEALVTVESEHEVAQRLGTVREEIESLDPTTATALPFLSFAVRMRRFSVFNARLIFLQRPGAGAVGTAKDWALQGRQIAPDAVPIIILWRFGPVALLYELDDTLPAVDRSGIGDPFAVRGWFDHQTLARTIANLGRARTFKIEVRRERTGFTVAGHAAIQDAAVFSTSTHTEGNSLLEPFAESLPSWRVTLNDRLSPEEQFVTLAHELAHIFCGHLGPCPSRSKLDSGWPDRRSLGSAEKEIEAEAVAIMIAKRACLHTRSDVYLSGFVGRADLTALDWDTVARATSKIEKFAQITYSENRMPADA